MTDTITITGLVATSPRHINTAEGLAVTSFRLASNLRRFDRKRNEWVDAGTNWYTVSTYRQLALNVFDSVQKSDRVVVSGRLRIREWADGDKKGLNIDVDATTLGHDLSWGKAVFTRNIRSAKTTVASHGHESESNAAESDTFESDTFESDTFDSDTFDTDDADAAEPAFTEAASERQPEPITPF